MLNVFKTWMNRYFSDPQAVYLLLIIVVGFTIILTMGQILAPVLAAIVIAYMLDGAMIRMSRVKIPRGMSLTLVFSLFIGLTIFALFALFPILGHQLQQMIHELPVLSAQGQEIINSWLLRFPEIISQEEVTELTDSMREKVTGLGQYLISLTLASLPGLMVWMVYLVLVPLMVFFFLKDKGKIHQWFVQYLPEDRHLSARVWEEVDHQLGNFIKGKVIEMLIVGIATYAVFVVMGMKYSALLGFLVGISVFIPYVGAFAVTIPVALVAFFQWGWSPEFAYLIIAYGIVQALDGNVLVPILFSEAVNLHPIAIIVAILVFGGIWGIWGVFFAIPLAILIKAVLNAWPRSGVKLEV